VLTVVPPGRTGQFIGDLLMSDSVTVSAGFFIELKKRPGDRL
jgi:hypothetical protein